MPSLDKENCFSVVKSATRQVFPVLSVEIYPVSALADKQSFLWAVALPGYRTVDVQVHDFHRRMLHEPELLREFSRCEKVNIRFAVLALQDDSEALLT
jgi:hypothetical protein